MLDSDSTKHGRRFKDLTGKRFGRLVVLEFHHIVKYRPAYWLCRCDCGKEKAILGSNLRKGLSTSCGCYRLERITETCRKHGCSGKHHPRFYLYTLWLGVRSRCYDPTDPNYPIYGGRGIRMEEEWEKNSTAFINHILSTLGDRPSKGHSLDRTDPAKGYIIGNLRWATRHEQNRNKRTNRWITAGGETLCITDWAKRIGKDPRLISVRIAKLGWSEAEAVEVVQRTKPPTLKVLL